MALLWIPRWAEPAIPAPLAAGEVEHLLRYVGASPCSFQRNSTWHTATQAEEHLRAKQRWLTAAPTGISAEDFIEKAATQSAVTGAPYQVRCGDGTPTLVSIWLTAELARFREINRQPVR